MASSELHLILGPMFAGKSTYLIDKVNNIISTGITMSEILLINHSSDARYDTNKICSHNGKKLQCLSLTVLENLVIDIINQSNYQQVKYIFIDEGQFFNDLYNSIITLIKFNKGIQIFLCGLDGDFQQNPFCNSGILSLIPYSTSVVKLSANCSKCNNKAPFTKRITPNNNQTILVGGADSYQPTCLTHLLNND